jgi:hypothetical protein
MQKLGLVFFYSKFNFRIQIRNRNRKCTVYVHVLQIWFDEMKQNCHVFILERKKCYKKFVKKF